MFLKKIRICRYLIEHKKLTRKMGQLFGLFTRLLGEFKFYIICMQEVRSIPKYFKTNCAINNLSSIVGGIVMLKMYTVQCAPLYIFIILILFNGTNN